MATNEDYLEIFIKNNFTLHLVIFSKSTIKSISKSTIKKLNTAWK